MDFAPLRALLERLLAAKPTFVVNPPLSEAEVATFESRYGVRLPADYRTFVTTVADGGIGVFPLGYHLSFRELTPWQEDERLSEPFPHVKPWNDLRGRPDLNADDYDRKLEVWEADYFAPRHAAGSFPIADLGCGIRDILVVTGPEAGHVWRDDRTNHAGLAPLRFRDRPRITFTVWYTARLEWFLARYEKGVENPPREVTPERPEPPPPRYTRTLFDED